MARLVPVEESVQEGNELADLNKWLDDDDPWFEIVNQIVTDRGCHTPRALKFAQEELGILGAFDYQAIFAGILRQGLVAGTPGVKNR